MKSVFALCKVEFISLLTNLNFIGSKKKKSFAAPLAILIGFALMVYIGVVYSLPMATIMIPLNLDILYWAQIILITFILCLSLTFLAGSSILFSGKDMDFLFTLPISSRTILFCKLIALYLENLLFTVGVLVSSGFVYSFHTDVSPLFWLVLLVSCVTLPLIATTISAVLGFLVSAVSSYMRFKNLFSILLAAISMVVLFKFIFSWQLSLNDPTQLATMPDKLWSYFLPLKWISDALSSQNLLKILPFVLFCVAFLAVFLLAFSPFYQKIVVRFSNRKVKSNFKMKHQSSGSCMGALLKKEAYRFFGTPVYLLNSGMSVVLLVFAGGYLLIKPSSMQEIVTLLQLSPEDIALQLTGIASFFLLIAPPSNVTISLENKSLWLLQSSPISCSSILLTKVLFSCLVFLPGLIVFLIGCQFAFYLPIELFLLCAAATLLCLIFGALTGIVVNLHFPRLDAPNDTIVVKQSASVVITMLIGLALIVPFAFMFYLFGMPAVSTLILAIIFLTAVCAALGYYIKKQGEVLFLELTEH